MIDQDDDWNAGETARRNSPKAVKPAVNWNISRATLGAGAS
jgi:hypothetical protein